MRGSGDRRPMEIGAWFTPPAAGALRDAIAEADGGGIDMVVRHPYRHESAAAQAGSVGLDDVECERNCQRGVDRIAAELQHLKAGLRRRRMRGAYHALRPMRTVYFQRLNLSALSSDMDYGKLPPFAKEARP